MRKDEGTVQERLAARVKDVAWRDVERSSGSGCSLRAGEIEGAVALGEKAAVEQQEQEQEQQAVAESSSQEQQQQQLEPLRSSAAHQLRRRVGNGSSSGGGERNSSSSGSSGFSSKGVQSPRRVQRPRKATLSASFTPAEEAAILTAASSRETTPGL